MATMFEESVDDVQRKTFHEVQGGVHSVVHNRINQIMLDLFCKGVIGDSLEAQFASIFDTNEAAKEGSKSLDFNFFHGVYCPFRLA